jgi:hypothetical protein
MMNSVSSELINRGGILSAAYRGEDIFLLGIRTTLPPRKMERGKIL